MKMLDENTLHPGDTIVAGELMYDKNPDMPENYTHSFGRLTCRNDLVISIDFSFRWRVCLTLLSQGIIKTYHVTGYEYVSVTRQ